MRQVPGIHSCREVLNVRPRSIKTVYVKENYKDSKDHALLVGEASKYTKNIRVVNNNHLNKIVEHSQGLVFEVDESPALDWNQLESADQACLILLDGLEDPHNLGAILRTAWLMGVDGIVTLKNRAVGLSPTVCKVAAGGAEYVPLDFVSQLVEPMKRLKEMGFWVYGLSEQGEKSLYQEQLPKKTAVVLGAEESGLKKASLDACDFLLRIPQTNQAASYNVSVAAAISLAEVFRQNPR